MGAPMTSVRQTFRTAPPELLSLDTWIMPALDDLDVDQKQRFHTLVKAIRHYVDGGNL